jgi:2-methylcitrate dehydratase
LLPATNQVNTSSNITLPSQAVADGVLEQIADYVLDDARPDIEVESIARLCLMDSLGCALQALSYPACTKLLGPIVPGALLPKGTRVPGTSYELDPVRAAFNIGAMIRWLDFNDTWLAAEWGHPSDNFGAILSIGDYLTRQGGVIVTVGDALRAAVQAYEIQGVLALSNSFNRVGLDHVLLVRVASAAVVTKLVGGSRDEIISAISNAFIDGGTLRTYRHAPNTGSRKSWAAGDAASRAVFHGLQAIRGEMGYPSVLSTPRWGFEDVLFSSQPIRLSQTFGSYVMRNVLFKISFPAEFHAQTAVEAALQLFDEVKDRWNRIARIVIETQESGKRIIDKTGHLRNPADRDHCIQYMVAVPLLRGQLTADDYEDVGASDPRIDALREKMEVVENEEFSRSYMDPSKRAIPNAIQVFFEDGSSTRRVEVEFPVGHPRRRREGESLLFSKFERSLRNRISPKNSDSILRLFGNHAELMDLQVSGLIDLFVF